MLGPATVKLRGLRLGIDRANFVSDVDPSVAAVFEAALARLRGLPPLSLPIGLNDVGLPVGLELDGLEGSDETELGIGLSMERPSSGCQPPFHRGDEQRAGVILIHGL